MNGCESLKRLIGAEDISCCSSCHEDWEFGYDDPIEVDFDGKTYFVCCAVAWELDQWEIRNGVGVGA